MLLYKILKPKLWESTEMLLWEKSKLSLCLEHVTDFCSLSIEFNSSPFLPTTAEDYDHVDWGKTMLINDWNYAQKIAKQYPGARIFGVIKAPGKEDLQLQNRLLGFDILDKTDDYSCITYMNLYPEEYDYRPTINKYGLLENIAAAYKLKALLREKLGPNDWHARYCEVWAVFNVANEN